ncbi:MAG: DUF2868 domain-containing protein [Balneolaceae bacterium]
MPGYKKDIYSKIEALTGLKLFNSKKMTGSEKKSYRNFFKNEAGSLPGDEKLNLWYFKFIPKPVKEISRKITRYFRLSSRLLVLVSFIVGISAAGVLFYYDGSAPINVLPILAIFVILPLTLLFLSLIFSFPTTSGILSPFLQWIEGRIEALIPAYQSQNNPALNEQLNEYELVYNEPVQILFRNTLQKASAAYALGALIWMIFNVTTTDLAFSWSSTLELEGENIHNITTVMSAPWSWFLPAATVDLETVEATRFFRAGSSDIESASSGRWWSFIFMSIVVYSLFPRFLVYFYYRSRFKKILAASLVESEAGHNLLSLSGESLLIETTDKPNTGEYPEPDQTTASTETNEVIVLLWYLSELHEETVADKLNRKILSVHQISGLSPVKDDRKIAQQIAKKSAAGDHADIIVFVKFWESPNIRLERILKEIADLNKKSIIKILPLVEKQSQQNTANKRNWGSRMASLNKELGKKRIYVESERSMEIKALA